MIKNYIASHHMYIHNCLRRCSIRKYKKKRIVAFIVYKLMLSISLLLFEQSGIYVQFWKTLSNTIPSSTVTGGMRKEMRIYLRSTKKFHRPSNKPLAVSSKRISRLCFTYTDLSNTACRNCAILSRSKGFSKSSESCSVAISKSLWLS